MHRLFIDEVGHHNLKSADDPNERYLCLVGVIMELEYATGFFQDELNSIKREVFGSDTVVLHRHELVKKFPAPYDVLRQPSVLEVFDRKIFSLIADSDYTVISVIIDKKRYIEKYKIWHFNPYHYCLTALVERYVNWLGERNLCGDVMAEARDKTQNKKLSETYAQLYKKGTGVSSSASRVIGPHTLQACLTSGELKLKPKFANVAGLQLADLIASPARRHLVCHLEGSRMTSTFGRRIVEVLMKRKYRRALWRPHNVKGYGVKFLP